MFLVDTIKIVRYFTPFKKEYHTFKIKEVCGRGYPLFIILLDDQFFAYCDSQAEAREEINLYIKDTGYKEAT